MHLYLLSGMPGQSKSAATSKIEAYFKNKSLTVGIGSVEAELLKLFPDQQEESGSSKDPLVSLIGERPQIEIKNKWPEAYNNAVAQATANNPDIAIVTICFEYYRTETYEFYSPVDGETVRLSKPRTILTLIDDIYEVYYRLSQTGQVFDIRELIERRFPPIGSGERSSKDLRRLYKDALIVAVGSILRVLVWREKEIECGANLARTSNCDHTVLATKHPVETGARLLLGPTSVDLGLGSTYPVYVSHPISRPRRDRLSQGSWPPFVDDLETVVASLAKNDFNGCHVVPLMPTAIDEFRILDDGTYLHPSLTPRWKIHKGELLYKRPNPPSGVREFLDDDDFERRGLNSIFDPPIDSSGRKVGLPLTDPEVSGVLRTLKESIQLQMAGRDHLLVRQCPGFFLYRPLYGEFEFSGGVASEIHTFHQIRNYAGTTLSNAKRLIVFIHDKSDAQGVFNTTGDEDFPEVVRQASAAIFRDARELVSGSNIKTKMPLTPQERIVADALKSTGSLNSVAKKLHEHMFPAPKEGSIGSERPLPLSKTEPTLVRTLEVERVKALSSDISKKMVYNYSRDVGEYQFQTDTTAEPDTYVDVVDDLDKNSVQRVNAAIRSGDFFAKGAVALAKN